MSRPLAIAFSHVGTDPSSDLAVVRVSAPASKLHPVAFDESSNVQVGETVYAIGNPFAPGSSPPVTECSWPRWSRAARRRRPAWRGDVIVALDGKPVHTPADLADAVASRKPGDAVRLEVLRGGAHEVVSVTLGNAPQQTT